MIEQQYYTRERRGIFRPSEGYDSVAKSRGLNDNFIKKYLHPFCFYDPPRSFDRAADKDSLRYPDAYTCFNVETGDMVVGRTVFKESDFTGLRSTYFTHNLVIPMNEKKNYIRDMERVIYASGFADSYNIDNGTEIKQLDSLEYADIANPNELSTLAGVGVSSEVYKKLLYAAINSASGKRNIYINLGVDICSISDYAKILLKYVLKGLPYEIRENTGYITYMRDPENRRYVNIMFVEDEGLRAGCQRIDREFVFDLAHGRVQNVDINTEGHPYLNFIVQNIYNLGRLQPLYDFISDIICRANAEMKFNPGTYDELCILFQLANGNFALYDEDRKRIYGCILKYYPIACDEGRARLNEICRALIEKEIKDIGQDTPYLSSLEIIKSSANYYSYGIAEANRKILFLCLLALIKSHQKSEYDYLAEVFSIVSKNREMNTQLINIIMKNDNAKHCFDNYLQNRFSQIGSFQALSGEIRYWTAITEGIIGYSYFQSMVLQRLKDILHRSANVISEGNCIDNYFGNLPNEFRDSAEKEKCREFAAYAVNAVDEQVYRNINVDSATIEDLKNLHLKRERNEERYEILEFLHELVSREYDPYMGGSMLSPEVFKRSCGRYIKNKIQSLYKDSIEYRNYSKIIFGFIENPYSVSYDFDGLLMYISQKGKSEVYDFLLWSFEERVFCGVLDIDQYYRAIRHYFKNYDSGAFKDKKVKKKLYGSRSPQLTDFLRNIELELMSPAARFFRKHRRKLVFGVITLIAAAALAFGAMKLFCPDLLSTKQTIQPSPEEVPAVHPPLEELPVPDNRQDGFKRSMKSKQDAQVPDTTQTVNDEQQR